MGRHGKVPEEHDKLGDWRQGRQDAQDEIDKGKAEEVEKGED